MVRTCMKLDFPGQHSDSKNSGQRSALSSQLLIVHQDNAFWGVILRSVAGGETTKNLEILRGVYLELVERLRMTFLLSIVNHGDIQKLGWQTFLIA